MILEAIPEERLKFGCSMVFMAVLSSILMVFYMSVGTYVRESCTRDATNLDPSELLLGGTPATGSCLSYDRCLIIFFASFSTLSG